MPRRKQRSSFDEVSKFDRGRIVAYRDCGLSFREIGSRVGRNQTTAMRICDHWMQEGTTDRHVRSHPPQCTTSRADRQIVRMAVADRSVTSRTVAQHIQSVTHHPVSARTIPRRLQQSEWNEIVFTDESRFCLQHHDGRIRVWRHRGERMLNSCVMHRHTGLSPGIMVWGGIEYHSRTPLVRRIAGTLNIQHYISEVLEPVVLPYLQGLPTAIFQQDNARPHVACIVQRLHPQLPHQINFANVWKLLGLLYPKNTSKVSLNQCRGVCQRQISVSEMMLLAMVASVWMDERNWWNNNRRAFTIPNSTSFIQDITNLLPPPNSSMCSFDVSSLFRSLAHSLMIDNLHQFLSSIHTDATIASNIISLTEICLCMNTFTYSHTHFKQIRGTPMGSPLSSILSEITMSTIDQWICDQHPSNIFFWRRYVDDIFCICKTDSEDTILSDLHTYNPNITFTLEREREHVIPFLDAQNRIISHLTASAFPLSFIEKHTYSPVPLNPPAAYKSTCVIPFSSLSVNLSRFLKPFGIRTFFTNTPNLHSLLRHPITKTDSPTDPLTSTGAVYSVSCQQCTATYVEAEFKSSKSEGEIPSADGVNPGGALNIRNRQHQTTLTRFRTGHLKPLKIENNNKIYPTCPKCSLAPAAPEHILACIRCTKQDLWERPLLIIKQLEEHELMEFV
ncbi:hypothetical protein LAZ67_19002094 [Cordylochernes scorpioides]|uniref:Reverse transcriptase domain-containing protein n=1 Tax=Cordylochernes scorpioides TaxID=51811 RepID=A0ABY6LJW5_9ARAC|nr:hypothetical protein LAZ67_19002094 [Cordylochernes scorpioides]